jgi:hypothetical protein
MDFYLQHPNEINSDLNRSVDICLIKDDIEALKKLEEELFYNQMCSLFGDDADDFLEDDENDQAESNDKFKKVCTVKEFAILFFDGNCVYATGTFISYFHIRISYFTFLLISFICFQISTTTKKSNYS